MQPSNVYKDLECMIEKEWLVKSLSEIEQMLAQLEKDGQITRTEYRSLLELFLAKSKKIN